MDLFKNVALTVIIALISTGMAHASITDVTVSSPPVDLWTSDINFTVNFTATSDSDAQFECFLYLNSTLFGTNGAVDNNTVSSILSDNVTNEETYDFYVECADSEGNMSSSTQNISFDRTLPIANIVSPDDLNSTFNVNPQVIFYATDNMADVLSYEAFVNGETENQSGSIGNSSGGVTVSFFMSTRSVGNHTFVIQVTDYANNSQNSTERTITVLAYPTTAPVLAQSGVSNLDNTGIVHVNWTADSNAESYRIYRSDTEITDASALTQLAEVTGTEYNDTTAVHGETYWYAITTVNIVSLENKSVVSDSFNVTVNDTVIPRLTTEVSAISNANGSITLNWTAVTLDVQGNSEGPGMMYRVFRTLDVSELDTSSASERIAVTSLTTYTDTNMSTGNNYTYVITTLDGASNHNGTVLAQNQVELEAGECTTNWSEWSACSAGQQTRTRACFGGGETSQTQSCSSGGGGGGGSGSSFPPGIGIASQVSQGKVNFSRAGIWYHTGVRPNEQVRVPINDSSMSVSELRFNPKRAISSLSVSVGEVQPGENPHSTLPRGQLFRYLEITTNVNSEQSFEDAIISFRVPLEWLGFQNAEPADVNMYRLVEGNWVRLNLRYISSDTTHAFFEATTPGFSFFAIVAEPVTTTTTQPTTTERPPAAPPTQQTEEAPPSVVPVQPEPPRSNLGWFSFFWFFVVLVTIVVAVLFFMNKNHMMPGAREETPTKEEKPAPRRKQSKKK